MFEKNPQKNCITAQKQQIEILPTVLLHIKEILLGSLPLTHASF